MDFNAQLAEESMDVKMVHEGETHRGRRARNRFNELNKDLLNWKYFKTLKSNDISVKAGNMMLSGVSQDKRIWTFTPNAASLNGLDNNKVWLLAYFENLTPDAIEKAKKAALLFFRFKMPSNSASCLVDRFDQYPL